MSFDLSDIKIEKIEVTAKSRTLSASWTMEYTLSEEEWNELQQKEYEVLANVADQPELYHQMMSLLGLSYSDYLNKIEKSNEAVHIIGDRIAKELQKEIDNEILASLSMHLDSKR
jgi:sulfur transfer complex TusBCD TusB component (DsrH family)